MRRKIHSGDASILAARIRQVRELAGYKTSGQLWKAIKSRGGHVTRGDSSIEDRKLFTMLTRIRELNPSLARVVEGAIISAHAEVLTLTRQHESRGTASEGRKRQSQRRK